MNVLDTVWVAAAAICLCLALLHLSVWVRQRGTTVGLAFSFLALSVVGIAACELGMMHAGTPEVFAGFERWIHVPIFTVVASVVLYVHLFFGSGRLWLGHAAWITRLVSLVVNFAVPVNVTHRAITTIGQIEVAGQTITVVEGPVDPWTWMARLSLAFLLAFILDSAVRSWRAGGPAERRRAWVVGGSLFVFVAGAGVHAGLVMSGAIRLPYATTLFFLGAVVAAGRELGRDLVQASRLSGRLLSTERTLDEQSRAARAEIAHLSRVALVSEMAGAVAHELNQPLGAILSNAQAMRRILSHDDPDLDYLREILGDVIEDDRRAGEIIHRLRSLLRKGELEPEAVAVSDLVQQILRLFHGELVERRVNLSTDFPEDSAQVSADRVQLQQVILNLLVNACDAMAHLPPGQRVLTVRTEHEDGIVRVSVADQGNGIPPDQLDRIFEPFYTTKPQGLGMGLSIGRRIALAHGGNLAVTNNVQGGATFHFTLPALDR